MDQKNKVLLGKRVAQVVAGLDALLDLLIRLVPFPASTTAT